MSSLASYSAAPSPPLPSPSPSAPPPPAVSPSPGGWPHEHFVTRILPAPLSGVHFSNPESVQDQHPLFSGPQGDQTRSSLEQAAQELRGGGVVAFPTETVYGLGADARNASAVERIYAAKGRPADNPLIVHISDTSMLSALCNTHQMPPAYNALMHYFWPGSLTLLFPVKHNALPSIVTAQLATVGIRMPSHPLARALIALAQCPVAAPSSNASGRPSPTCAQHVYYDLGGPLDRALHPSSHTAISVHPADSTDPKESKGRIRLILDGGAAGVGLESTVVDGISHPGEIRVLRPGGVAVEAIEEVLQNAGLLQNGVEVKVYGRDMARDEKQEQTPTTPGMKYRHYSPNAPVLAMDAVRSGPSLTQVLEQEYEALGTVGKVRGTFVVGLMVAQRSPIFSSLRSIAQSQGKVQEGVSLYTLSLSQANTEAQVYVYDMGTSAPDEAARRLFGGLRYLDEEVGPDKKGCALILVETVARDHLGLAVMNRLDKAASGRVQVAAV